MFLKITFKILFSAIKGGNLGPSSLVNALPLSSFCDLVCYLQRKTKIRHFCLNCLLELLLISKLNARSSCFSNKEF